MRDWNVAGGLLSDERGLLLVANQRVGGSVDWTTPGGVIDDGETPVGALTREVAEETGLIVDGWRTLCWTVEVDFVDLDTHLNVEVHAAGSFSGVISLNDPDGIVTAAEFMSAESAARHLRSSPLWVSEPLTRWIAGSWDGQRHFAYSVQGTTPTEMRARRRLP